MEEHGCIYLIDKLDVMEKANDATQVQSVNNKAIVAPPKDNNTGVHLTIGDKNSASNKLRFIGFTKILFPKIEQTTAIIQDNKGGLE